jgi:hypothetical protein
MLQKVYKTAIAEILANATTVVTCQIGTSDEAPTDTDDGLKGTQLVAVDLTIDQDGAAFVAKTSVPVLIPTGTAKEVVFKNQDNIVMDRVLISPIVGGPLAKIELEYKLEAV